MMRKGGLIMNSKEYMELAESSLMHTYNRYPIVWDHGEGVYLYDLDGKKYLDFAAGIAVFALGYQHKKYNDALHAQIDKVIHVSNYYYTVPMAEAAKKLVDASGMDKVFFTNSGTESIEGALKLAKRYYYNKTGSAEGEIIAMDHSFHGRSTGALAVTGTKKYREPFGPLMPGISFAVYNDLDSVKKLVTDKTCAIILEPVQGEGGIYPAEKEFLEELRKLCDEKDIALIFDEIQCGMGRTGTMFAYQGYGVTPDVMTCAKALGCGVPVGAFAAKGKFADALVPGDHGTTYGGNPLATAAVSAVFDIFKEEKVLENVNEAAGYLWDKLEELKEKHQDKIAAHRGKGLMQGLEFQEPVGGLMKKVQEEGLILISAGTNVVRFVPPLVIGKEHVDEMVEKLEKCL
jgi:acetylornithine/N-succinyldiaminopimelate aminotransferase